MGEKVTSEVMRGYLGDILEAIPAEWRGTTFRNSRLLQREGFAQNMIDLIAEKKAAGGRIVEADLRAVGNAEDYLRVSSNISTTLELFLALERGCSVSQVFTFASRSMPVISVLLTAKGAVHLYLGEEGRPFSEAEEQVLAKLGATLQCHAAVPGATAHGAEDVVLAVQSAYDTGNKDVVHGVVAPHVLHIRNPERIAPANILVVRKRTATPVTTPMAEGMLQRLAGLPETALEKLRATDEGVLEFRQHLQLLSGTPVSPGSLPAVFSVGLAAICSLWVTLATGGGADILMCSTAYGGSSQLTDVLSARAHGLRKHTFDIQGTTDMNAGVEASLTRMAAQPDLFPTTLVFVEIPTNPDMKVPNLEQLVASIASYRSATGREVLLLVDTTFAPGSGVMGKFRALDADLPVLVFISMSKSISRGHTVAGTMVANHTPRAAEILRGAAQAGALFDTTARPDQLFTLTENHHGVEERCQSAYEVARLVGTTLQAAVRDRRGVDMPLAFVTPEQAKMGFTSSTFSFNLPPPEGGTPEVNAALAQRFVDLLTEHKEFKPCVSFGQDNSLVYATVPATSTQGAIREEDKAKQAVGGVQLVRLSFPPTINVEAVQKIVSEAVCEVFPTPN
mmetsp:Transcript_24739/g.69251  ORF Transcript_24739/g.69251 Transcript_24739/m.69251 type:complete len:622 (+) Transcript_24739:165-2030(+)|eukprot:CAMPEP_0119122390 /NCGR_PEP_ID=MMETSP1310-20130426/2657_1 /TAXON_ID=464262 /ORGANISM="Genus nov. species nov., Strain RCC2339" /LENGTH=621 /DNA_ID=CAMNT_0007112039 /DNA_START=86 /DNA_END=1951 /DNA_ORIENTATION=+